MASVLRGQSLLRTPLAFNRSTLSLIDRRICGSRSVLPSPIYVCSQLGARRWQHVDQYGAPISSIKAEPSKTYFQDDKSNNGPPPPPKREGHSRFYRLIRGTFLSITVALIGMTSSYAYLLRDAHSFKGLGRKPTHLDETTKLIEEYIQSHPFTASLRANPNLHESRPHLLMAQFVRPQVLTAGVLSGPNRIAVPPLVFQDGTGQEYISIQYLGNELCGHPGLIHGGLLATILDEGLARCCFPALPNKLGMTANLDVNYRSPCVADQYVVLIARTVKVEGRKAWVEGRIETLPSPGEIGPGKVLVEASALMIEPRQAIQIKMAAKLLDMSSRG